jgi:hypothetical protein
MDKINKFLIKLGSKERLKTDSVIEKILNRDFTYLDIKKLKGEHDTLFLYYEIKFCDIIAI